MTTSTNKQATMPSQEDFAELVKRANAGDDDALAMMRQTLDSNPEIWESVGNLATHAQLSMVKLIAAGNKLVSESLLRKAKQMKTGIRVALHPACSEWMQGDRFGVIVGRGNRRQYHDHFTGKTHTERPWRVKLDVSGRIRRFHPRNISEAF